MGIVDIILAIDGVADAGACPYDALEAHMSEAQRAGARRLLAAPRTVLCALFPYYSPPRPGNISLYARGRDYHDVIREALSPLCAELAAEHPGHRFLILADDSPLPEVTAGALAGLGKIGRNGLLLHPKWGSFLFLGTILTDLDLGAAAHAPVPCPDCGACARACPVGLDKSRCLSGLTQKGGALTDDEAALVRAHPLVWGCDLCQLACPFNRELPAGDPAFTADPIDTLTRADLDGLTRRQFGEKYAGRAFTWKGPRPILRNLTLKEDESP